MNSFINLITINWLILTRFKGFVWTLFLWFIALIFLLLFLYYLPQIDLRFNFFEGAFKFPIVFNTICVSALLPAQLICILQIILICKDFSSKTYRLFIINGMSSDSLLLKSIYLSFLLSLFTSLIVFTISILVGVFAGGEFNFYSIRWVGIYFFQTFCYSIYGLAIGVTIKDIGISSFIYILWFSLLERIIAQLLNYNLKLLPLGNILPGKIIENKSSLIVGKGTVLGEQPLPFFIDLIFTLFWLIISILTIRRSFKKTTY